MLTPGVRVGDISSFHFICAQIKAISHDNAIDLSPRQLADRDQIVIDCMPLGQDEGSTVRSAFGKLKWGRRDIHLPVTDQDIAVTAESAKALVLVEVGVVSVQKATVTDDEVKYGILIAIRYFWIAPEHIVDLSAVMFAARGLAIAIKIRFAAWITETLEFESFSKLDKTEIRIGVAARRVKVETQGFKSPLEPVLKMELLVAAALAFYKFSTHYCPRTGFEYRRGV